MSAERRSLVAIVMLFTLVCLIWGTTWIAIKYSVEDLDPLVAAGLRFLVAAPLLIGLCRARGIPLRFPPRLGWFGVFVTICYFGLPYLLLNVGEQHISSGLTAICFSSVCVLIVVMSVPVLGNRLAPAQLVGVIVAFAALVTLVTRSADVSAHSVWGVAAVLGAAVMHSFSYVMTKKYGAAVHVLTLNTVPMAIAGLLLTGVGLATSGGGGGHFTERGVLATLYLGVVASVVCFLAYFWLLQRLDAVTVSFVFVIFPVIAQVLSVALEQTRFDVGDVALTAVILGAFASTQLAGRRKASAKRPVPSAEQLELIYEAARRAYPAECCGFVRRGGVRQCRNVIEELVAAGLIDLTRDQRSGFAFASEDLLELAASIDTTDPVVLVYHSHPDAGAYFSEADQRYAVVDGIPVYPVDHLVVDARADHVGGARRFSFDDRAGRYVPVEVYGDPAPAGDAPVGARSVADRRR
ncbi:MAG: putative rane protein PagO [Pseudonocardiales bacterium]|nr:putative rane protein PagO [Pseudonocardiales bacterium]